MANKITKRDLKESGRCVLCKGRELNMDHMFFKCYFSSTYGIELTSIVVCHKMDLMELWRLYGKQ